MNRRLIDVTALLALLAGGCAGLPGDMVGFRGRYKEDFNLEHDTAFNYTQETQAAAEPSSYSDCSDERFTELNKSNHKHHSSTSTGSECNKRSDEEAHSHHRHADR